MQPQGSRVFQERRVKLEWIHLSDVSHLSQGYNGDRILNANQSGLNHDKYVRFSIVLQNLCGKSIACGKMWMVPWITYTKSLIITIRLAYL